MRKERNEAETSTTAPATAGTSSTEPEKVVTQQESISENEESDTITDHSSSMSEHKKRSGATQFSVQRSDTDCLRMRISAIRPTVSARVETKCKASTQKSTHHTSTTIQNTTKTSPSTPTEKQTTKILGDKVSNTLDALRIKLNQQSKKLSVSSTMSGRSGRERSVPIDSKTLTMSLAQSGPCLSDATESGCSEATTTTIAAVNEKTAKKVKVKRKKATVRGNDVKHKNNKKSHQSPAAATNFTSDSDDDAPLQKLQQQRAPRLLLTAINSKNSQLKTLNSLATSVVNENLGLSSSDNELPDLVSAAIKRVESDNDDTGGECSSRLSTKVKHLPQYQSTLLQDFVEKTQKLCQTPGVTPARIPSPDSGPLMSTPPSQVTTPKPAQSNKISANSNQKKRRGRPKKGSNVVQGTENTDAAVTTKSVTGPTTTSTINESADSGVISTTSTAQSSSPSPRLSAALISATKPETCESPTKSSADVSNSSTSSKPKIDFVNLDKRMYATERVLYPPPRNKRRQSTSAAVTQQSSEKKPTCNAAVTAATKITKDELQLDPVWRKIDVNKKFRRPSVSGYKSDGGGGNTTICSKILAAQSGYVSDYGSAHPRGHHHSHNSGYKSDASAKSRYSTRSCVSTRRSRAKSCGYRSDCKDADKMLKSAKFRRKRRTASLLRHHSKSVGNLNDDQDILQLAGLTLGQSSEESNEYVCKPSLKCLPTTSVSKKYGEINRFVATGEYFGRGSSGGSGLSKRMLLDSATQDEAGSQDGLRSFSGKLNLVRKNSIGSELAPDMLSQAPRKIKSRRSSAASYCSSYYSGVSKVKRRRRRRSFRFPTTSKATTVDSKLLTEIEIITNTFATLCRIGHGEKTTATSAALKEKEKLFAADSSSGSSKLAVQLASVGKRETRDKRSLKKRKLSENLDFALLSASAGGSGGSLTPSSGSTKRRHKKTNSSSPDDHKLPLKKRHYLLTPGEKSTEAAAIAVKLFANNAEALAAAAAAAKSSSSSLAISYGGQPKFGAKGFKPAITPKKRHLLQTAAMLADEGTGSVKGGSNHSSPLRISVEAAAVASLTSSKLLDISPALSTSSGTKQNTDPQVHKKRTRLEGLVSKIANQTDPQPQNSSVKLASNLPQLDSENSSCPPPGVFEPTVELEIQIPPIAKLTEAAAIITKSEVDSPLLLELNKTFPLPSTKVEGGRVVESLLNKTGGNLLLKRKRKKFNRTGFPTVRRKKRKINENLLLDVTPDIIEQVEQARTITPTAALVLPKMKVSPAGPCDRVPQTGEASDSFLERANRGPPRLSVVSLERLQGTSPKKETASAKRQQKKQERLLIENLSADSHKIESPKRVLEEELRQGGKSSKQASLSAALTIKSGKRQSRKTAKALEMTAATTVRKRKNSAPPAKSAKSTQPTTSSKPLAGTNGILTQKELKAKRLLPAGIDPNINFSCKIRLKRRSSLHGIAIAAAKEAKDCLPTEPVAKDPHCDQLEHDILPMSDVGVSGTGVDSEGASDTSDEKSSSAASTLGGRKNSRWKKNYLTAGLFSEYYKCLEPPTTLSKRQQKKMSSNSKDDTSTAIAGTSNTAGGDSAPKVPLLAPPPYCEKFFRRSEIDFELPYDIWWAYKNEKLPARVTVPSWNYRKIRTNIYAESVRPNMAGFDHPTCNCKPDIGCGDDCLNRLVYTECSPTSCPTREKCRNQKIYRHEVAPGVERFMTENKGWGVRTKLPIQKGTYILEYVGEVVTEREFKDRMGTIYLNDTHHYCLHLDGGLVIDGHRMGSDGRFVNHSCQPNCEMQKWSVNGLSRMALFAARNINADEELTYDYNFSLFNPSEGQPCRCNTPQCRGVIGGKSQRIKPLLSITDSNITERADQDGVERNVRQRKRKAKKHSLLLQSKDIVVSRVQQLSEKDKKYIKQHAVFLLRNFEKVRKFKAKHGFAKTPPHGEGSKPQTPIPVSSSPSAISPAAISNRRPSTPASLAAQISALRSPRNMKTRGLALANSDPELEKMAKMAVILRDICATLEALRDPNDEKIILTNVIFAAPPLSAAAGTKKKKLARAAQQKEEPLSFLTIQTNIEKGFYKQPTQFDADMQLVLEQAKQQHSKDDVKLRALAKLSTTYVERKREVFKQLLEVASEEACQIFLGEKETIKMKEANKTVEKTAGGAVVSNNANLASFDATKSIIDVSFGAAETEKPTGAASSTSDASTVDTNTANSTSSGAKEKSATSTPTSNNAPISSNSTQTTENVYELNGLPTEDIIQCICGLYKDEGLMIQCARCMVWQHTECTKADVNADNYLCERCEPRQVNREIPLDDFTEDGHRYYLSLLRGDLHIRQGDTVYVLRDIPVKDDAGKIIPAKKHTYDTIGTIEFSECDIFRVERLWKNEEGKRFIFGHHFLRPHETFHEPTRRFYPNEVVRVPLYEVVPIELVIGRCWVLDRTTFCKGRPMECNDESHCYICELRVDKTARFFSKAKINYPTCTKNYAFRKFAQKLKIAKTYAPHDVDPAMLKTKKQKTESEAESASSNTPIITSSTSLTSIAAAPAAVVRNELNKTPSSSKKRPSNNSSPATVQVLMPIAPTLQTIKAKRSHLEEVLKSMKLKSLRKNTQLANEPPLDLTYLLSGRGARQRKSTVSASNSASSVIVPV